MNDVLVELTRMRTLQIRSIRFFFQLLKDTFNVIFHVVSKDVTKQ